MCSFLFLADLRFENPCIPWLCKLRGYSHCWPKSISATFGWAFRIRKFLAFSNHGDAHELPWGVHVLWPTQYLDTDSSISCGRFICYWTYFPLVRKKKFYIFQNKPFFHSSTSILKMFNTSTSGHENLITPSGWLGSFPPYLKIST